MDALEDNVNERNRHMRLRTPSGTLFSFWPFPLLAHSVELLLLLLLYGKL